MEALGLRRRTGTAGGEPLYAKLMLGRHHHVPRAVIGERGLSALGDISNMLAVKDNLEPHMTSHTMLRQLLNPERGEE